MIAFSGIDCGGKSTQIDLISQYMKDHKIRHRILWSRGGYTPCLEAMKTLIRSDKSSDEHGRQAEQYRAQVHANPKKRKLLLWLSILDLGLYYGIWFRLVELFGFTILADRYFWDSYIDFKLKYPEFDFEQWCVWRFAKAIYKKPEHSIIYTIPAEVSMYRSTLKDEPWPETREERAARIDCYMEQVGLGRWQHVIDATASIEEVERATKKVLCYED